MYPMQVTLHVYAPRSVIIPTPTSAIQSNKMTYKFTKNKGDENDYKSISISIRAHLQSSFSPLITGKMHSASYRQTYNYYNVNNHFDCLWLRSHYANKNVDDWAQFVCENEWMAKKNRKRSELEWRLYWADVSVCGHTEAIHAQHTTHIHTCAHAQLIIVEPLRTEQSTIRLISKSFRKFTPPFIHPLSIIISWHIGPIILLNHTWIQFLGIYATFLPNWFSQITILYVRKSAVAQGKSLSKMIERNGNVIYFKYRCDSLRKNELDNNFGLWKGNHYLFVFSKRKCPKAFKSKSSAKVLLFFFRFVVTEKN